MLVPGQGGREPSYQSDTEATEDAARGRAARSGGTAGVSSTAPEPCVFECGCYERVVAAVLEVSDRILRVAKQVAVRQRERGAHCEEPATLGARPVGEDDGRLFLLPDLRRPARQPLREQQQRGQREGHQPEDVRELMDVLLAFPAELGDLAAGALARSAEAFGEIVADHRCPVDGVRCRLEAALDGAAGRLDPLTEHGELVDRVVDLHAGPGEEDEQDDGCKVCYERAVPRP